MSFAGNPPPSPDSGRIASSSDLAPRVRTALVSGILAILAILASSEIPVYLLLGGIVFFAAGEIADLFGVRNKNTTLFWLCIATASTYALGSLTALSIPFAALLAVAIGTGGIIQKILRKKPHPIDALSLGWIAGPLCCAIWLHGESADTTRIFSPNLLALVAIPIWLGDTAAYFVGKAIGKTPLAPKISPKKTVEGAIANLLTCIASSLAIGHILNLNLQDPIPTTAILAVGATTGILGQVGDLLESALKRSTGSKDSGSLLPGHGGILDRIDSFLVACVPATIILWIFASNSFT